MPVTPTRIRRRVPDPLQVAAAGAAAANKPPTAATPSRTRTRTRSHGLGSPQAARLSGLRHAHDTRLEGPDTVTVSRPPPCLIGGMNFSRSLTRLVALSGGAWPSPPQVPPLRARPLADPRPLPVRSPLFARACFRCDCPRICSDWRAVIFSSFPRVYCARRRGALHVNKAQAAKNDE